MKIWLFRGVALGIPLIFAIVVLGGTLMWQGRLAFDRSAGQLRWQNDLLFIQESDALLSGHRYVYDPVYGWKNIPNWRAWTNLRPLSINARGMRGPDVDLIKPPSTSRLLVLGDSFAWGYGVGDDEVFTRRLEARLISGGENWQVLNGSVSGWGTDQELLFLEREGIRFSPDVVVLAFFIGNDPENVRDSIQYNLHKPIFTDLDLELENQPVPLPGSDAPRMTIAADPLDLTLRLIERMDATCSRHGSRLVVMKFGMFLQPEGRKYLKWDRNLRAALHAHPRIFYFDLDAAFTTAGLSLQDLIGGNANGHWNALGHDRTADLLHTFLEEHGLLRERSS